VYSWGGSNSNQYGQLGRGTVSQEKAREPSPITDILIKEVIVQIACGAHHCLALAQQGALFAWGHNKAGQLGFKDFNPSAPPSALVYKTPAVVEPFRGKDAAIAARSCSCGPESSACVTLKGDVYVWGAISFYFFEDGSKYDLNENCTVPVKIRGVQNKYGSPPTFCPDQIAVHRRTFACTLGRASAAEDLQSLMGSLKIRSSRLSAIVRSKKQSRDHMLPGDDGIEQEEIKTLNEDFKKQRQECSTRLTNIDEDRAMCRKDLQAVNRDLTVCDQQDTSFTDWARHLEARKSEGGQSGGANKKTIETQLSDVQYFKDSNKRTRMGLLAKRDRLEQQMLQLDRDFTAISQQKASAEGRMKLISHLQHGGARDAMASIDEGLEIAMNKRDELAATEPQTLANSSGRFSGVREILAISERALQDVSSALKEINSAANRSEGSAIVEALESNLKLRKEYAALVQEKVSRAERGRPNSSPLGGTLGMRDFFQEASMRTQPSFSLASFA
jgi:hypothetical protein